MLINCTNHIHKLWMHIGEGIISYKMNMFLNRMVSWFPNIDLKIKIVDRMLSDVNKLTNSCGKFEEKKYNSTHMNNFGWYKAFKILQLRCNHSAEVARVMFQITFSANMKDIASMNLIMLTLKMCVLCTWYNNNLLVPYVCLSSTKSRSINSQDKGLESDSFHPLNQLSWYISSLIDLFLIISNIAA